MTLPHFHRLTPIYQQAFVLQDGILIGNRQEPRFTIALYAFELFYVELFYHKSQKAPIKILAFDSTDLLVPYLDQIDISEVV